MGEEADPSEYNRRLAVVDNDDDDDDGRVLEWEIGLPSSDDLTPLSQPLVPPKLASAFSIQPEPVRTNLDVHRAIQETLTSLRRHGLPSSSSPPPFPPPPPPKSFPQFQTEDPMAVESEDPVSDSRIRRQEVENSAGDDPSARTLKRQRLVWTPQLHKRFVEVVARLGIRNAVPKTIMQLMNVEGLTRENVASHLQKYRLYLKRMQGLSNEGPSASDPLFASIPVPQNLQENPMPAQQQLALQPVAAMPYAVPTMIPMPMYGIPPPPHHNGGMGMVPVNNGHHGYEAYHHHHHHHGVQYQFGGYGENQGKNWASGSKFGTSVVSYPPNVTPNNK